jgi:hypothetical protein
MGNVQNNWRHWNSFRLATSFTPSVVLPWLGFQAPSPVEDGDEGLPAGSTTPRWGVWGPWANNSRIKRPHRPDQDFAAFIGAFNGSVFDSPVSP